MLSSALMDSGDRVPAIENVDDYQVIAEVSLELRLHLLNSFMVTVVTMLLVTL